MNFLSVLIIAIALSLDAFGVALSLGIAKGINNSQIVLMSLSFGFFQYLMSFIGGIFGVYILSFLGGFPKVLGGAVISVVGLVMFIEGFKEDQPTENIVIKAKMFIVLGVSVSIDALVVGLSALGSSGDNKFVFLASLIIGIVSFINSIIAFIIGRFLREIKVIEKYAEFIGGIILMLMGIKMMFM